MSARITATAAKVFTSRRRGAITARVMPLLIISEKAGVTTGMETSVETMKIKVKLT